ncbi:MAG: ABC transporter substrate-binding protein [Dehalococcoidia bacterium]
MPSATELVWPVSHGSINVSWDPDSTRLGQGARRSAGYHQLHIPYEPLTTPRIGFDAQGVRYPVATELQPRLALSWEPSNEYRTWTFRLRPGVRSNRGNELNAESVRWSWERVYNLQKVGYWRSNYLAGLRSMDDLEVLDEHTLRFNLGRSNPEFAEYTSFATNNIFDATAAKPHATAEDPWAVDWLSDNIAGFGAFALEEQSAERLRFRGRDDYWAGKPGLDSLTMVGVSSRNDAMRMIEQGEANYLPGLYPEELARFAGRPGYQIIRVKANHSTLEFNWLEAPFDDQKVRQAVCYALPYERIMLQVYMGYGRISKTPIPTVSKYSTEEYWHYDTNIETARRLLQESGHPDGFETVLYIQPSNESLRFGEIVRESLKPIGITVEVRFQTSLPFGTKVPMWFREECGHALYDPMYDLGHDYDPPPGMWGNKNIVHPLWTEKMRAIREASAADQPELYRQIQRDIVEFAPCAHIAEVETGWVIREPVHPWALSPLFLAAETTVWSAHRQLFGWW